MNFGALVTLVATVHTSICSVLGADWRIPDRVSLRRLVKHSTFADGRVLSDPLRLSSEHWLVRVWFPMSGTIGMLAFGYKGEDGIMYAWTGFRCRYGRWACH